jgi:hypothetical protein
MRWFGVAALLSFNGGFVDTAGFLGLQGLFTAHVTGNFVTLAAALVLGTHGVIAKWKPPRDENRPQDPMSKVAGFCFRSRAFDKRSTGCAFIAAGTRNSGQKNSRRGTDHF